MKLRLWTTPRWPLDKISQGRGRREDIGGIQDGRVIGPRTHDRNDGMQIGWCVSAGRLVHASVGGLRCCQRT
jgi:hypothetical protein